jgi:hypothetical protein
MPSIGQENLETVMIDFFGALRRGYFDAAAALLDPDVRWQGLRDEWVADDLRFAPRLRASRLRAGRLVLDLLGLAQGVHRFVDGQEDCRLERAKRTAATNRQRNRGHRHVVGRLPKVVAVVSAEGVPEPVELPTDRLDVRLSGLSAVLWVADQPGPSLRRVAEPRQIERHRPSLSFADSRESPLGVEV